MSIRIEWGLDLGDDYRAYPIGPEDVPVGIEVEGPAGPNCTHVGGHDGVKGRCSGTVWFEDRASLSLTRGVAWKVEQEDPLTLSPSILCDCGSQHGHIREGRWQP